MLYFVRVHIGVKQVFNYAQMKFYLIKAILRLLFKPQFKYCRNPPVGMVEIDENIS